jgi:hypothetical protein
VRVPAARVWIKIVLRIEELERALPRDATLVALVAHPSYLARKIAIVQTICGSRDVQSIVSAMITIWANINRPDRGQRGLVPSRLLRDKAHLKFVTSQAATVR